MEVVLTLGKLFSVSRAFDRFLANNDTKYKIGVSYKLLKTKEEIDNATRYVTERINLMLNGNSDENNKMTDLSEEELNIILSQDISITIPEINVEEIIENEEVTVNVNDFGLISSLFTKKDG